ncbi:MAG: hypothetical protein JSV26_10605 [bacterium]|nr:MAG: hypothetical protein JSV26_10605 [bacterium]
MLAYYRKRGVVSLAVVLGCAVLLVIVRLITEGQEPGADIFILVPMGVAAVYGLWCLVRGKFFKPG